MKFQKRVKAPAKPLTGRVAVVAGATRGVGRGIALMLGEAGAMAAPATRPPWGFHRFLPRNGRARPAPGRLYTGGRRWRPRKWFGRPGSSLSGPFHK
jgi:hypothetical protein